MATLVFVHAHPDDEALLTSGTMARAAAEGHRVVLVVATDGNSGLTSSDYRDDLAATRRAEVLASADLLRVSRVELLGYADSGLRGELPGGLIRVPVEQVAAQVTAVLDEERADVVVGYDPSGGYGHPDHVRIHEIVRICSAQARYRPRLFEATLPREPIVAAVRLAAAAHLTPADFDPDEFARAWTPRRDITHRVNVRDYLDAKRASLAAHASQAAADDGATRTLAVLTRLPRFLFAPLMGTEYYVDPGRQAGRFRRPDGDTARGVRDPGRRETG